MTTVLPKAPTQTTAYDKVAITALALLAVEIVLLVTYRPAGALLALATLTLGIIGITRTAKGRARGLWMAIVATAAAPTFGLGLILLAGWASNQI